MPASHLSAVIDRDSVCAGDDCEPHEAKVFVSHDSSVVEFLASALRVSPLASISGGEATWLIDTAGPGNGCIGVIAQQWTAPKLLIPETTTIEALFGEKTPTVFFRYWCQADPEAVFEALKAGRELTSRYRQ